MSFVAPTTGSIATIDGGSSSIASGTIQIVLNVKVTSTLAQTDYTMEVVDIGAIEVDYNYIEDIGDVNEFTINVPTFEFTMQDRIRETSTPSNVESFVEVLAELDPIDLIVAKVTLNSKSDYYYTTRDQCEFSYMDRKIKLKLQHPLKYGAIGFGKSWSNTTFTGKTVNAVDFATSGGSTNVTAVFPRDLIELYMPLLGESSEFYYDSELYTSNINTAPIYAFGAEEILIPTPYIGGFGGATIQAKRIAFTEAAIIGNILGSSFYVPRHRKDSSVKSTFDADDFEDIELDYSFRNVRYFDFFYEVGGEETAAKPNVSTNGAVLINDFGSSNVSINYGRFESLFPTEQNGSVYDFGLGIYDTFDAAFSSNITSSYKQIFQISNTAAAGISISGTILGIDSLKPHGYFTVSSGVHPLVDGKDFRPSYLKFDLKNDKIEFEAYSF